MTVLSDKWIKKMAKSNKMITLSTHKIDKSSLQSHELDLLDTIED